GNFPEIFPHGPRVSGARTDQLRLAPGTAGVGADLDPGDSFLSGPGDAEEPIRAHAQGCAGVRADHFGFHRHGAEDDRLLAIRRTLLDRVLGRLVVALEG